MFARIYREDENKELLINLNHVSLIEVKYSVLSSDGKDFKEVKLRKGANDPAAIRMFKFRVDGESFTIAANNLNDPLTKALGTIYNEALKGVPRVQDGGTES